MTLSREFKVGLFHGLHRHHYCSGLVVCGHWKGCFENLVSLSSSLVGVGYG